MYEARTPWGQTFVHPRMTDTGIAVSTFCYAWGETQVSKVIESKQETLAEYHQRRVETTQTDIKYEVVARQSSYVFEWPRETITLDDTLGIVEIPATYKNLQLMTELPFIDMDSREQASDLLIMWTAMEKICMAAIMAKAQTVPLDGQLHRMPVRETVLKAHVTRPLTDAERSRASFGRAVPSKADRTTLVDTKSHTPALQEWLPHARSKRPYSQQLIGAQAAWLAYKLAIWYDMRTGKTLTAQMVAKRALAEGEIDLVVVVCPRTNMYDPWEPECLAEGFDVRILDGTAEEDEFAISERDRYDWPVPRTPNVYIINYERVGSRLAMMVNHWDLRRVMVILDETSAIKNPDSKRSKACHQLTETACRVLLLNGTPMEQGPLDLWSQMRCVDPFGIRWERTPGAFERKWLMSVAPGKYVAKDKMAFEMLIATTSIRYVRGEADQFSGKDKNFRYVSLRATKQMFDQSNNVQAGFVEKADGEVADVTTVKIAVMGFLREICCGYDKYREIEHGPYVRERHEIDPKLLWIRCFLEANPTEPLIIYCEFNEQEERLKEMLDEMRVSWASTKSRGRSEWKARLQEKADWNHRVQCLAAIREQYDTSVKEWVRQWKEDNPGASDELALSAVASYVLEGELVPPPSDENSLRYDPRAIEWFRNNYRWELEDYRGHTPGKKYSPQQRAQEVRAFNEGDRHVFICKTLEAKGISLSRKEAVAAGRGVYPSIIYCAPCWSLGIYDQSQDRAVTTDPRTNKSVCTMVYLLIISGSIEEQIAGALRSKKDVQQTLLKDAERKGFASFLSDLIAGMAEARTNKAGADEYFDAEEMMARIHCGVPPLAKLTDTLILNRLHDKISRQYGLRSKVDTLRWLQEERPDVEAILLPDGTVKMDERDVIRHAFQFLMDKIPKEGVK